MLEMINLYIDPGTGMILIQLIVSAFAAVALFFKRIKSFIKSFFNKK